MTNTLALAARLRALDDDALHSAIGRRAAAATGIRDFFDLAEALLQPDSIQRALTPLDRFTLAALAAAAQLGSAAIDEVSALLVEWGASPQPNRSQVETALGAASALLLVDIDGEGGANVSVYEQVRAQLASWPEHDLPSGEQLAGVAAPVLLTALPAAPQETIDRLGAERAFDAVTAVTELISELMREPALELQKGGLALPSAKRLATALSLDVTAVAPMLSIARRACLVTLRERSWLATAATTDWLALPTRDRWAALAGAWLGELPEQIRALLARRSRSGWGDGLRALIEWSSPAAGDTLGKRLDEFTRDAEMLGLADGAVPSTAGIRLLDHGVDAAAESLAGLLPDEVDKVYVLQDLSIVSPGPLDPAVSARLRTFADVEGRALASTYRVSESSINRAIAAGAHAAGLLSFLDGISLSGIPQPLEYLVTETAERFGRVRVGPLDESDATTVAGGRIHARSYVRSADAGLLSTLEVDQSLSALGFTRAGEGRLVSRFARDDVFWALTDARYPVAAESAERAIVPLRRVTIAPEQAAADARDEKVDELVRRLRAAEAESGPDAERAWLRRQLDIAVKARVALTVSVAMPDGREVQYTLEPTGVGGGRLRGRDRAADIERTLPLSSIRSIESAD
ncbi:helicase-associated domain-containing protein [Microbacterium sp. STN6]|uniref:helicase-associated domain-containing protein n=1 Tax=Microbacterium sp. STN6 TaxID=2995588 RepID=UPI0022609A6F|nr:helicase-associated domain-containing protein [Microbacterium sp. STN6]MCX7523409.1 helicase-associated domain-containing protein [Microbacterium sp. STN6]